MRARKKTNHTSLLLIGFLLFGGVTHGDAQKTAPAGKLSDYKIQQAKILITNE